MRRTILFWLNVLSAMSCFVIGILLTLELGFDVSPQNRELYSSIHLWLIYYFLADLGLRFLFSKRRELVLAARFLEWIILLPLIGRALPEFVFLNHYVFVQFILLVVMIGRLPHVNDLFRLLRLNPAQLFIIGFMIAVFLGSLLLSLPISQSGETGLSFLDAVFTATSAVCVTGLVTQDIGTIFSGFGQGIILVLIQLGGLGIMSFYAFVNLVLNRKVSQTETVAYQESFLSGSSGETFNIVRSIFAVTLGFELIGMAILFFSWRDQFDSVAEGLFYSAFHSVSAFCNAGFSLFSDSLAGFAHSPPIILTISFLIIVGGIGFPVLFNLLRHRFFKMPLKSLKIHTKIPIITTLILILLGTGIIFLGEHHQGLAYMPQWQKWMMSFFHSVSSRSAGFSAVSLTTFSYGTLWILILLMFVGASPGSTGGGVKTTTFGVLVVSLWRTIQGRSHIEWFGRTITTRDVYRALAIIMVSVLIISTFVYGLLLTETGPFMPIFFETISAFGTVGFTMGLTETLSSWGKVLIIILMFLGRVGPLTFAFALARRKPKPNYQFPEERLLLG